MKIYQGIAALAVVGTMVGFSSPVFAGSQVDCSKDITKFEKIIEEMESKAETFRVFSPSLNMDQEFYECVSDAIENFRQHRYSLEKETSGSRYQLQIRTFFPNY